MASSPQKPALRRFGMYALVLLALGLVSSVIFVVTTDEPVFDRDDTFPQEVLVNTDRQPKVVFPDNLRTHDLSLNRFVDRFVRVCQKGKYSDFRLMFSTQSGDPILPDRFGSIFTALKEVRILQIDHLPKVPQVEGSVYLLTAEYELQNFAPRSAAGTMRARLAIHKEEGQWRIGPLPREATEALEALMAQKQQQEGKISNDESSPHQLSDASDWEVPKAAANQPVRLDQ